jgi:hypothetical protein
MKTSVFGLLIFGAFLVFTGCSEDSFLVPELNETDLVSSQLKSAVKPAANLKGTMDLTFMGTNPVWVGTITFQGYPDAYGMRFFHLSPQKGFSQASPFEEYFEIYDMDDPDHVYLGGPDVGVTVLANKPPEPCTYRMNGEIDVANAPFEMWLGRHVHMGGIITWQVLTIDGETVVLPLNAPGKFRIN